MPLPQDPEKKLDLKEDPDKGVYVKDLTAVVVKDYEEIDEVMKLGNTHRTVGATAMVRRGPCSSFAAAQCSGFKLSGCARACSERGLFALPLAFHSGDRNV